MKTFIRLSIFSFALLLFSCTDPCENVSCLNDGVCDDGTCMCTDGYEGSNCETESRLKYYGTFSGSATCPGEDPTDQLIILSAGPEVNQLLLTDQLDPEVTDTFTLEGNIASSPEREINFLGIMIKFQIDLVFNSTDEIQMIINQTVDGFPFTCEGTLNRD